jgi:hypothetical protein
MVLVLPRARIAFDYEDKDDYDNVTGYAVVEARDSY